jgi:sugar lactone lactonase YvrE
MHSRPAPGLLAIAVAMFAAGCGGGTSTAATNSQPSTGGGGAASSSVTAPLGLPNPFTITARYSARSLGLNDPANLAIGPDGNLYVTDASQHVTVISPQGKVLRQWGQPGKGPRQFSFITQPNKPPIPEEVAAGIAIGIDGHVYVADSGNARIEVFTRTGGFLSQFGSFGYGNSQFLYPSDLAVDGDGNVYVSDGQKETLSKFSPSGAFVWGIGGTSETDPDLIGHFHLSNSSIDSHGRIITVNDDQNRIVYIDAMGNKVDAFGSSEDFRDFACGVTVNMAGYTFVNSCQEPLLTPHYTEVFDRTHNLVGTWYPSPFGLAPQFGPNGEVFALGEDGSIIRLRLTLPEG